MSTPNDAGPESEPLIEFAHVSKTFHPSGASPVRAVDDVSFTIHAGETLGLIGDEALSKVKPSVRIVNAARGGIVDEAALARAIAEGRVAGAGIDVFATEPTTESPLFEHESVVVTPHLGASTDEAQEKAGIAVAKSVRLALSGELVRPTGRARP